MQDSNPGFQTPNRLQTECSLTNWPSYRGSSLKLELDSLSLWSASFQPTRPHCQLAFAPGSGDLHVCRCPFPTSGTGRRFSNRKVTSCLPLLNAGLSPEDWMSADKQTYLSRIKLKTSTSRLYDQRAFIPLDPTASWLSHLSLAICMFVVVHYDVLAETNCLPLLNAGFEPRVSDTRLPADRTPADKPTELSRIKLKTWTLQTTPMISEHSAHSTPLPVGFRPWLLLKWLKHKNSSKHFWECL